MRRLILVPAICGVMTLALALPGYAAENPSERGQPSQMCGSPTAMDFPGNAASSPGSPFNTVSGKAGNNLGPFQTDGHSNSTKSVSQYDVACFQSH